MDSLAHEIMNSSAFEIANSMISGDISDEINLTGRTMDEANCDGEEHAVGYSQSGNLDYGVAGRLTVTVEDEESYGELVQAVGNGSGLNDGSSNAGVSTRLRRRKATQPQRLVYCDLDFNLNEDANLGNINEELTNNLLVNGTSVETSSQYTVQMQCVDQTVSIEALPATEPDNKPKSKGFQCEICGSFWNSKTRLRCHYRTHGAAKHLKCDICGKLFGWEYSWKTHMLAHSDHNPNKCPHCGLKLFNKTALANHIKRIHDNPERPFKCTVCSKSFISKSELNQHSQTHNDEKPFMCEQCGKTFRSKSYMERHYRTHSGIKPFKCQYCGKLLADKTGFTAHIRAHVGERPYMCDICGKKYTIKRHLTSHMIIHSDLRPFKCEECGKTFRSRTNFRMHKDSHLGIKRWSCKFCNRTFLSQGNMAKHVRRHIGDRKHKCEVCGKAFIEKQELKNHLKIHGVQEARKAESANTNEKLEDNQSTSTTNEGSTSNGDNETELNTLTLNQFREVLESEAVVDDSNINHHNQNHQTLLAPLQSVMSNVQLPPIHLSITNTPSIGISQQYATTSIDNTHNIDTSSLAFCDFQRPEQNRTFYLNSNQTSQATTETSQSSVLTFFPNQTTMNTTNSHGQYIDTSQQNYLHCSLCSDIFMAINTLREHLIEFHRVEPDKVLTMMY